MSKPLRDYEAIIAVRKELDNVPIEHSGYALTEQHKRVKILVDYYHERGESLKKKAKENRALRIRIEELEAALGKLVEAVDSIAFANIAPMGWFDERKRIDAGLQAARKLLEDE